MRQRRVIDVLFKYVFQTTSWLSVLVLLGIFGMLLFKGIRAFKEIGFSAFFLSATWNPSAIESPAYGMLSMIAGSFLVTFGAMLIAVPLGIGTAAYLSEIASERVRTIAKSLIELLAAIPSVAVGFMGIVLLGPWIARVFGLNNGLNALNGSLLLAIMSLPTIVTVAEDAIRSVPSSFKEGSYALGANKWYTLTRITLPSAFSGIIAAVILGMGRAIGETMTVLMATGNARAMPSGFFDPVRTMTATIAIELGEVSYGTTHYYALFFVGAVLFTISLLVNVIAERIAGKYRYKY